jgi:hypothetical protein
LCRRKAGCEIKIYRANNFQSLTENSGISQSMIGQSGNPESALATIRQSVIDESSQNAAPSPSAGGATDNSPRF